MIADAKERAAAIDVTRSCIVQAPAGSGKTELLIQRMLALLGQVQRPQQILAITFTNKAAAEMRQRLLQALRAARHTPEPEAPHHKLTWQLARQALDRQGEDILKNPAQLAIQTIDSFNAALVRKMPWLSRFGSLPEMTDEPDVLYLKAVERLCLSLDNQGPGSVQLELLLRHLDNQLAVVQDMLIDMLRRRDQWLRYLHPDHQRTHQQLQQSLEGLFEDQLKRLKLAFPEELEAELLGCLHFAAANLSDTPLSQCRQWGGLPGTTYDQLPAWAVLGNWLLTGRGELRKKLTKNEGFPPGKDGKEEKERMQGLLELLASAPVFLRYLDQVRKLPGHGYSEEQWQLLEALIELLPLLIYELWIVFRNEGEADFAEIALKAHEALGAASDPSDLLLKIDQDLQHILIDEFQDTSRLQYRLLETLTSGWTPGDGRTLFLVGDPMQSIYLFREAEVGLFLHSFRGAFGELQLPLQPLQLSCNFRSQQGIVDWVNASFSSIFPERTDETLGAVPLADAIAVKPPMAGTACTVHPFYERDDQREAEQVVDLVRQAQAKHPEQTIAILVRGRNHLHAILPLLHEERIPYRARDIDLLGARPAALDLVHLTKALLHRGDRLSWLAVLRAPWCGLTLDDLHALAGGDKRATLPSLLENEGLVNGLSDDGRERVTRVWPVLSQALSRCGRYPLRELVEACWLGLGGPACYGPEGHADARLVFGLLERLDRGGTMADLNLIDRGLEKIFSNPEATDCRLEIMTIHKAKGLEFDTVIIPGLGRTTGRSNQPLLRWFEHPRHGLLIAPLPARGSQVKDPLYQTIADLEKQKADLEAARLLYVATTRAIRKLHLLGHVQENSRGESVPKPGSLLEKLWPAVNSRFSGQAAPSGPAEPERPVPGLQRLPGGWRLPDVQPVNLPLMTDQGTASQGHDEASRVFSGWENPVYRHVGTLVHQQLEMISRHGPEYWHRQSPDARQQRLTQELRQLGVAEADVADGVDRVGRAVARVLNSPRGQWILANHQDGACEYPLTGVVEGTLIHAVIDRTFVADGQRWIVDYKTSAPGKTESLSAFLKREGARYGEQLRIYISLFKALGEGLPVRAALYFPLFDGWYELPE